MIPCKACEKLPVTWGGQFLNKLDIKPQVEERLIGIIMLTVMVTYEYKAYFETRFKPILVKVLRP